MILGEMINHGAMSGMCGLCKYDYTNPTPGPTSGPTPGPTAISTITGITATKGGGYIEN